MAGFENVANLQKEKIRIKKYRTKKNPLEVSNSFTLKVEHFKAGETRQRPSLPAPNTCALNVAGKEGGPRSVLGTGMCLSRPRGGISAGLTWAVMGENGAQREGLARTVHKGLLQPLKSPPFQEPCFP